MPRISHNQEFFPFVKMEGEISHTGIRRKFRNRRDERGGLSLCNYVGYALSRELSEMNWNGIVLYGWGTQCKSIGIPPDCERLYGNREIRHRRRHRGLIRCPSVHSSAIDITFNMYFPRLNASIHPSGYSYVKWTVHIPNSFCIVSYNWILGRNVLIFLFVLNTHS